MTIRMIKHTDPKNFKNHNQHVSSSHVPAENLTFEYHAKEVAYGWSDYVSTANDASYEYHMDDFGFMIWKLEFC